ncbi:MAG: hypothetical protein Q7T26_05110 [Dehalococcoidia bacterium]|nr:hypothetical protein [Dehalococcoidia bacterium]
MVNATWNLVNPTAPPRAEQKAQKSLPPPLEGLDGKTLGFLSNMWPSVRPTFARMRQVATRRFALRSTMLKERAVTSSAAPKNIMDPLANQCDAVIVALGN